MATRDAAGALKEKLRELVNSIVEADEFTVHDADHAIDALSALKDLKLKTKFENTTVPPNFLCPLSGHLMTDPVIFATGQTFDRPFIERWVNDVKRICAQTEQVLSDSVLTPNSLVHEMITQWCKEHRTESSKPEDLDEGQITDEHRQRVSSLLQKLSKSVSEQKQAAKELRQLTKQMPAYRALFGDKEVIHRLLAPISDSIGSVDPRLQEDLITTVLNASIHQPNKIIFGSDDKLISLIVDSVKSGTMEARTNAATVIFSLSALDDNRGIIGNSEGAIRNLVSLIEEAKQISVVKDAASALYALCTKYENKGKAVREGAMQIILGKISSDILVDEMLSLLANLANHSKGVKVLGNHGGVPFLLHMLRSNASEISKENCLRILHIICGTDKSKRKAIREDELIHDTLSGLAQSTISTEKVKIKAKSILEKIKIVESSPPSPSP
ncbi:hypothetical protein VNO77_13418 [Canavalia gladiata]|uniref:RING-type E3 ubiquitin transferase n=1 Tax=Canavalia gladiata TaxID=3824 RepID=A0AAN9QRK8_CANGL